MQSFIQLSKQVLSSLKQRTFHLNFFAYEPVLLLNNGFQLPLSSEGSFSINELMKDGMLWGVPKKKPTVESRLRKRFGVARYPQSCDVLRPRSDLVICERCGDHHEAYTICRSCYLEVKEETEKLKSEIKSQTDPLEPKEKEILLKFQNEDADQENRDNFRIIEVDRPRPKWFAANLSSKSTGLGKTTRDVILNPEDTIHKSRE